MKPLLLSLLLCLALAACSASDLTDTQPVAAQATLDAAQAQALAIARAATAQRQSTLNVQEVMDHAATVTQRASDSRATLDARTEAAQVQSTAQAAAATQTESAREIVYASRTAELARATQDRSDTETPAALTVVSAQFTQSADAFAAQANRTSVYVAQVATATKAASQIETERQLATLTGIGDIVFKLIGLICLIVFAGLCVLVILQRVRVTTLYEENDITGRKPVGAVVLPLFGVGQPTFFKVVEPSPLALPPGPDSLSIYNDWRDRERRDLNETEAPQMVAGFIDRRDLEYFCREIVSVGHAEGKWVGRTLPNGFKVGSPETYERLIRLFVECEPPLIVNRDGERRKTGVLVTRDVAEMMARLTRTPLIRTATP